MATWKDAINLATCGDPTLVNGDQIPMPWSMSPSQEGGAHDVNPLIYEALTDESKVGEGMMHPRDPLSGQCAVSKAIESGDMERLQAVLEYVNPNNPCFKGMRPLHLIASKVNIMPRKSKRNQWYKQVVHLLMDAGANPYLPDSVGISAIGLFRQSGRIEWLNSPTLTSLSRHHRSTNIDSEYVQLIHTLLSLDWRFNQSIRLRPALDLVAKLSFEDAIALRTNTEDKLYDIIANVGSPSPFT